MAIPLGLPHSSAGKESACNTGDLGSIPGLGRSPVERKGYPLQYSGLENSMDCVVHEVAKSWTQLSNFHSLHSLNSMLKRVNFIVCELYLNKSVIKKIMEGLPWWSSG